MSWLTINLTDRIARKQVNRLLAELGTEAAAEPAETKRIWITFALCFLCSVVGVAASLFVFGTSITGTKKWGIALVVAVVMLGLSYGAKYSNVESRKTFTPVDVLQYLTQGVLWPSTWPALAQITGVQIIAPPTHTQLLHTVEQVLGFLLALPV